MLIPHRYQRPRRILPILDAVPDCCAEEHAEALKDVAQRRLVLVGAPPLRRAVPAVDADPADVDLVELRGVVLVHDAVGLHDLEQQHAFL